MKSRWFLVLAIAGFCLPSCGIAPDYADNNRTGLIFEVAKITGVPGNPNRANLAGDTLYSDVNDGFNDDVVVTMNLLRKNNSANLSVSPIEHVYADRFFVRFIRTDGLNQEGVDVPYSFSGPMNVRFHTPSVGGAGEVENQVTLNIIRHTAKFEPPLRNLYGIFGGNTGGPIAPGQGIINAIAEITIYGTSLNGGETLTAKGSLPVVFADFADTTN